MSHLTKHDRLAILESVAEIASEAAHHPNIASMIEFQEQLVEALYRKMTTLIESDLDPETSDEGEEDEDVDEWDTEEDAAELEDRAAVTEVGEAARKARRNS